MTDPTYRCSGCQAEIPWHEGEKACPACGGVNRPAQLRTAAPLPSTPSPPVPAPGADLGGYVLEEEIGRGGMGVVYRAHQRSLGRKVAVKLLTPAHSGDPQFAARFAREAETLAALNHPHIVQVIDKGMTGEACYLVMEYVQGSNLRHILERGKLTPAQALHIVPQICSALEYAHARQIVHRDIKPENILITLDGEAKITDFGLARVLRGEAPEASTPLTGTQVLMGTVEYMAPEQRERARSVDHRADIYSLGVVFYEMLTGELPIGRFAPPSRKVAIDVRLDEVVLKALEKEPEQRYQRASHLSSDIATATSPPRPPQPRMGAVRLPDGQMIVLGEKGLSVLEPVAGRPNSSAPAASATRPGRISALAVIAFLLVLLPLAWIVVAVIVAISK